MEFVNGVGMTSRIWNGQEKLFETTNQPTKRRRIELVGGIPTPLKNISHMKVSWDYELPNIWKNKKCSKLVGGFNHFEKRRWDDIPYMKWKRKTVWNHQPANRKAKKFSESKATHPCLAFRPGIPAIELKPCTRYPLASSSRGWPWLSTERKPMETCADLG